MVLLARRRIGAAILAIARGAVNASLLLAYRSHASALPRAAPERAAAWL